VAKDTKKRNPLLGAAVLKELLRRRSRVEPAGRLLGGGALAAPTEGVKALYEGVLRDLNLTEEQVDRYLAEHAAEVEEAIAGHGRRGV
jgi:hypothetical protein